MADLVMASDATSTERLSEESIRAFLCALSVRLNRAVLDAPEAVEHQLDVPTLLEWLHHSAFLKGKRLRYNPARGEVFEELVAGRQYGAAIREQLFLLVFEEEVMD